MVMFDRKVNVSDVPSICELYVSGAVSRKEVIAFCGINESRLCKMLRAYYDNKLESVLKPDCIESKALSQAMI